MISQKTTMMTNLFFDTEFTGLHSEAKLISIGIVSEDGRYFYAELNDYDKEKDTSDFVKLNVLPNLLFTEPKIGEAFHYSKIRHDKNVDFQKSYSETLHCSTETLKTDLVKWLSQFDKVCFWGDCLAYDWVLFRKIFEFETMYDTVHTLIPNNGNREHSERHCSLPENVHYIPFDICTLFEAAGENSDINREKFVAKVGVTEFNFSGGILKNKHNALYDAEIISRCYQILMTYLNLSKTLNSNILDNLNSKTMETTKLVNPILTLSLQELNQLKIAISKNFLVNQISGNLVEDYRTRWHDIYQDYMKYLVNNYEEIVEQVPITSANDKGMTYGKIAEILIDKRIEWIEANSVKPNELQKKEPDVDNESKWIACKKEHDVFISEKDLMFTYEELKNAIDMARSLPKLDIDTIIACQIYLKTKL
jgi:hypothetical protein